jgi:hypothetical protein
VRDLALATSWQDAESPDLVVLEWCAQNLPPGVRNPIGAGAMIWTSAGTPRCLAYRTRDGKPHGLSRDVADSPARWYTYGVPVAPEEFATFSLDRLWLLQARLGDGPARIVVSFFTGRA